MLQLQKIEIYFEVDGQRGELTKSYLDSKYSSYPGYDPYVMVKVYASLTGTQERLTNIEFIIEENDILPRIMQNVTNGKYTSNTPSGPFGPTEGIGMHHPLHLMGIFTVLQAAEMMP